MTYYFSTSGGQTENIENSFLGAQPEPYLVAVDDPYDTASPRHRWTRRMSLASAQRRLGRLLKGSLRQIRVLKRGQSPRVVSAEVVGTGGTTKVSGPQLRSKFGLYDAWARFTVITSRGARGDGNKPTGPVAPATGTGGTAPRAAVAFAAVALPVAGTISGRIAPVVPGSPIVVERWSGSAWSSSSTCRRARAGATARSSAAPGCTACGTPGSPGRPCASVRCRRGSATRRRRRASARPRPRT